MYMFGDQTTPGSTSLVPGTYKLTFETPNGGFVLTQVDDAQATDATDSDADPNMGGMTINEVLVSGEYNPTYLKECFCDIAAPFKEHFVVDLSRPPETFVHPHHRRNSRKALNRMHVEECAQLETCLEDWTTLYTELEARHHITGMAAFSRESFAGQWRVPGLIAFRAVLNGGTVGMLMWYRQENRAYYHLGAHSSLGYETGASFALFDYSLDYFARQGLAWLDLGAGAGTRADMKSGLSRFKRGWATGTRTAYFCGRILNPERYAAEIKRTGQAASSDYFPAYRKGEFG
jgi:hypothetical protein